MPHSQNPDDSLSACASVNTAKTRMKIACSAYSSFARSYLFNSKSQINGASHQRLPWKPDCIQRHDPDLGPPQASAKKTTTALVPCVHRSRSYFIFATNQQ
ncbi:hypothetical protein [Comamonas sp. lk]|uniref:hypothetical protein n=1 Tax=Comamonas sp. lk TaxID=2201272 RepID=UPI0013CEF1C8|nr:hypothetical protein [Comamonas sp. lk]